MPEKLARLLKTAAGFALGAYVAPLRLSERLLYAVKGLYLTTGNEHLYRAARIVRRRGIRTGGAVVVDVGAADGGTVQYFLGAFPGARVIAFEPNPKMVAGLRVRFRDAGGVDVRAVALGDSPGESTLNVTADGLSSSLNAVDPAACARLPPSARLHYRLESAVPVEVSTLDAELGDCPEILLLKMDTQGTELDVLAGGAATLQKTRLVLVEMNLHSHYANTCQYHQVDGLLRGSHFRLVNVTVSYHTDEGTAEFDALYENTLPVAG